METRVSMPKDKIDEIFMVNENQWDALYELYLLVGVDIRDAGLLSVNGYPVISKETGRYIMKKAMAFDLEHHKNVMAGGCWLNYGFSSQPELYGITDLPDWVADISKVHLKYGEVNNG